MFRFFCRTLTATMTVFIFSSLVPTSPSFAQELVTIGSFMEENNYYIPEGAPTNPDFTEELFNQILDHVEAVYRPIVEANGGVLVINRQWNNGTVNASAQRFGNQWIVNFYGGLPRHPAVTPDGFYLVACHELGHHLAGAPKIGHSSWASNEGQSDYFSTLKCLRNLWQDQANVSWVEYLWYTESFFLDDYALQACIQAHDSQNDQALCARNTAAGMSVAMLFMDLRRQPNPPRFDTPDPKRVSRTNDSHPDTQCRLDTYFHGALCPIHFLEPVDNLDPRIGTCNRVDGFEFGTRPLCWYKPAENVEYRW